ncbi:hypothetical protein [Fusobacterium varium]|uniref:hypothetical protein n=1 Tax=Fusobacterium varium TaxID=856 RepID=UPI0030653298
MKILVIFLDTVRGDLSSLKNTELQETELEKFQKKIGGTYYINAYTVATDTSRAFATVRSGMYPKRNKCTFQNNTEFLKKESDLFSYLIKKNYELYILTTPYLESINSFSNEKIKKYYEAENLLLDYSKDSKVNKAIFMHYFDYHELVHSENTFEQERKARNKLGNILNNLLKNFENEFDKILLFSDHGYTLKKEEKEGFFSLKDNKTNVILQVRNNKYEKNNLKTNEKIVSLLDIFPTIISWFEEEEKYKLDGISLKNLKKERILYIEDGFCDWMGNYFSGLDLIKNYKIRTIEKSITRIYSISDLYEMKFNSIEIFNKINNYTSHLLANIQLYSIYRNKTLYLYKSKNLYKNTFNNEKDIKVYTLEGENMKALFYQDGTRIEKRDYYKCRSNYLEFKNNTERIKEIKSSLIFLLKESIKLILAYLYLYNFYIELRDKGRNKCGK